jgi:hypothetical protein
MSEYSAKGRNYMVVNQSTMNTIAQMWFDDYTSFEYLVETVKPSDNNTFSIQFVNKEET